MLRKPLKKCARLKTAIFLLSEDSKPQRLFEEPSDLLMQIIKALGYELDDGKLVPVVE